MPERLAVVEREADTPSTALTCPTPRLKYVLRFSTTSSGAVGSACFGSGRCRPPREVAHRPSRPPGAARPGRAPRPAASLSAIRSSSTSARSAASTASTRRAGIGRTAHRRPSGFGLRISSRALPTRVKARTTRTTQAPGGAMYHHAPRPGAPASWAAVEDLAPRRRERVAQPDEREGRLGEDRAGEDEDRVGDDEVRSRSGRMCRRMMWRGLAADDPGAIDEHPLLHRQGLRADDPGGRRPARDADDDDDDDQRDPDPDDLAFGPERCRG